MKKRCSGCKQTKPVDRFYRDAHTKDGLNTWCIACHKSLRAAQNSVLKKQNAREPWTDKQVEIVMDEHMSIQEMAVLTGRSITAVWIKRSKLKAGRS